MHRLVIRYFRNRYLVSLAAGYTQMGVLILIALVQEPLLLSYLGKAQFGLWLLGVQAASWLQLLDGGMNGALARYLIDYRHDPAGGALQRCLSTGVRVLMTLSISEI
jgi:O-antigen/teichoic acid export membrane protein